MAAEYGIQLLHFFESEWQYKTDVVKSIISNVVHDPKIRKIHARKCELFELSNTDKDDFLNENHIQGRDKSSIRIGLYYNKELVSIMTFVKSRFDKSVEYEMSRFCNKTFTTVVGGANKLFKYFIDKYQPKSIVTYSDRRLFTGSVYTHLGFKFVNYTPPSFFIIEDDILVSRLKYQKHKLPELLKTFDPKLTAWENMQANGFDRIWDCGHSKFVWNS
jgi:hypothetical protein